MFAISVLLKRTGVFKVMCAILVLGARAKNKIHDFDKTFNDLANHAPLICWKEMKINEVGKHCFSITEIQ